MDYLQNPNLLERTIFIENDQEDGRAIFIGIYKKEKFDDLAEFAQFTQNISSLTQDWYRGLDIGEAYTFYVPDYSPKEKCWFHKAPSHQGSLRFWLIQTGVSQYDLSNIPENLNGFFFYYGDSDEFGAVGETETHYFDAFIADS